MEIKRRLSAIGKRLTPEIEAMNVSEQMVRMCNRFDELLDYCEEKIGRTKERQKTGEPTIGQAAQARQHESRKAIEEAQSAEAEENLKDQEEAAKERQELLNKSKKPQDVEIDLEDYYERNPYEVEVPDGQEGVTDEQLNPKKKKASKKKKK